MPSAPDANWSVPSFPRIPSVEDMIELSEKVVSGSEKVLSILDQALYEFDEAVSEIGSTSRN